MNQMKNFWKKSEKQLKKQVKQQRSEAMFIVFDGPDGSGKSTLIKKISVEMQLDPFFEEYAVFTTREPGSTSIGKKIRKILLDAEETPAGLTEFLLFLADRAEHY